MFKIFILISSLDISCFSSVVGTGYTQEEGINRQYGFRADEGERKAGWMVISKWLKHSSLS